ncbi:MAG: hypothetical protein ACT4O6_04485 [Reyranella sp.]
MKRALIILPLLAVMAGVASAQMLQPPAAPPAAATAPVPVKAKAELPAAPRQETAPSRIAQTVVTRQAPVPMLLTKRPPVAPSATSTPEPANAETTDRKFSETDARAAIEADGYKRPRIVSRAADGSWQARALRGTIEVSLRVDAQGNVTGE